MSSSSSDASSDDDLISSVSSNGKVIIGHYGNTGCGVFKQGVQN